MGVPTSEVGYIPAMPRREDHEALKDMWGHWRGEVSKVFNFGVKLLEDGKITTKHVEAM